MNEDYNEKIHDITKNLIKNHHDVTEDLNGSICVIDEDFAFIDNELKGKLFQFRIKYSLKPCLNDFFISGYRFLR